MKIHLVISSAHATILGIIFWRRAEDRDAECKLHGVDEVTRLFSDLIERGGKLVSFLKYWV